MPRNEMDDRIAAILRQEAVRLSDEIPPPLERLMLRRSQNRFRWAPLVAVAAAGIITAIAIVWPTVIQTQESRVPAATTQGGADTYFTIPSYSEDVGLYALFTGPVTFTIDGCPVLGDPHGRYSPAFFPNALGRVEPSGVRAIVDAASKRVIAVEGRPFKLAGGYLPPESEYVREWNSLCPSMQVHGEIAFLGTPPD